MRSNLTVSLNFSYFSIEDFVDEFLVNVASGSDEVNELFDLIMFSTLSLLNRTWRYASFRISKDSAIQ